MTIIINLYSPTMVGDNKNLHTTHIKRNLTKHRLNIKWQENSTRRINHVYRDFNTCIISANYFYILNRFFVSLSSQKQKYSWQALMTYLLLALNNFIQNLVTTKSSECKSVFLMNRLFGLVVIITISKNCCGIIYLHHRGNPCLLINLESSLNCI